MRHDIVATDMTDVANLNSSLRTFFFERKRVVSMCVAVCMSIPLPPIFY